MISCTVNRPDLIDSDQVDAMLNSLTTEELVALIHFDDPLKVVETETGQRWDKEAVENAVLRAKIHAYRQNRRLRHHGVMESHSGP